MAERSLGAGWFVFMRPGSGRGENEMKEDPKFGTDGVRGKANEDLSAYFAFRLGRTAGQVIGARDGSDRFLLGRDPRLSGDMLRCALTAGFLSVGAQVVDLGILPTAGVAYLVGPAAASAGAMISASHNPAPDNGIKFFGRDGRKIPDETETEIEHRIDDWEQFPSPTGAGIGCLEPPADLVERYMRHLVETAPARLDGMRIVVDCANGAAYEIAPRVLEELGAEVIPLSVEPDGTNINAGCGALHPEAAQAVVRERGAHLAISLDGDADRAIFADEHGRLVDGDRVMAICAIAWKGTERLPGNRVVGTVMSNVGLELGLKAHGVELLRAPVGDRHVADMMAQQGAKLGGEKSGHIIFGRLASTGDGILTALQVAGVMHQLGQPLSLLADQIEEFPQRLVNVPVWRRRGWRTQPDLWAAVHRAEERLGGEGRILVRASGTERIIRVMAEGPDAGLLDELVGEIAGIIREQMGAPPGETAAGG
jgi:phosphoglucosamine mutase